MKRIITGCLLTVGLSAALMLSGCTTAPKAMPQSSGFLPDYSRLQPVTDSPSGTQIYIYNNPLVNRDSYHGVIIKPVQLYQTTTEDDINNEHIQAARTHIQNGIEQIIAQKSTIAHTPTAGIASLTVAITGAQLEGEGFKPWNIIPVSAAIRLASTATGLDNKTPVLVVELKFVDSVSAEPLREIVTVISGEQFRNKANTTAEFEKLAQHWVQQALQYSATHQ